MASANQRAAPVRGVGWGFLHCPGDNFQPRFHRERRHPRGPRLVTLETGHAFIEIPLLPAPDCGLRRLRTPHDLEGAMTIRRRQHDLGAPDELARRVAVGGQSLKLSTVGGAKVKADVGASHPLIMPQPDSIGNLLSGGEH